MDGQRFDDLTRTLARGASRRLVLRGLAAGAAGIAGLVGVRGADARHKALGAACNSSAECSQTGGAVICASNGVASDGAKNCCRQAGGVCASNLHCCGDATCRNGRCSGGSGTTPPTPIGRALGSSCTSTGQCSQAGGAVSCGNNGNANDGAKNCCRNEGGVCTTGAQCCGDLICADNGIGSDGAKNCCHDRGGRCTTGAGCCFGYECVNGVCTDVAAGTKRVGAQCNASYECSQRNGATVCADNGYSSDGTRNCCRNAGGHCTSHRHCCGRLQCVNERCTGVTPSNLAPGSLCTGHNQCGQSGGPTTCADNGIADDGALNCCREAGGACSNGSGCCGDLVCADNGIPEDGALNCCRNAGGRCSTGSGCCGALRCVNGTCQ